LAPTPSTAGTRAASLLARLDKGVATPAVYGLVALLSFPTLETIRYGTAAPGYALDVFDADGAVPRIGATLTQLRDLGPSLWDPRMGTGIPTLGHAAITPIAPDVAIGLLAGPFVAYAAAAWLLALLAGWGMHRFLRDSVGLPIAACFLGGLIYLFSFWHYVYGFAAVVGPAIFWAGDRLARSDGGRARALVVGVGGVALGAYAGLSQIVVLVGGLHILWIVVGSTAGRLRGRLTAWLAIWGLGMALHLPVILSQLVLLPVSTKTLWGERFVADSNPFAIATAAAARYAALIFGVPVAEGIPIRPVWYGTWFTGALGLFLLGCTACFGLLRRPGRFVVLALLAIVLSEWLFLVVTSNVEVEGLLKSFQVVRVRHLVPFVVAVGVAYGAGRVLGLVRLRAGRRTRAIVLGLATGAFVVVGAQAVLAVSEGLGATGGRLAVIGWWAMAAAMVAGLAALVVGIAAATRERRRPSARRIGSAVLLAVLLLAGAERVLYAHAERLTASQLGTWRDRVAMTDGQSALLGLAGPSPGRTLTIGDHPQRMSMYGLEHADGYVAASPRLYHEAFGALIQACLDDDPAIKAYFEGWGQRFYAFCPDLDPEVLDLLGVRWIRVVGQAPAVAGLEKRFDDGREAVYENPDAFPRAFLVGGSEVVPDMAAARRRLGSADRETLAGTAIIVDGTADAELPALPGSAGTASAVRTDADVVAIQARATRPAILVLTDVAYPDWHAEVDGIPVPIITTDLSFRGVVLSPGDHSVVFRYRPTPTYLGFTLAGFALVVTVALTVLIARRDRRSRSGSRAATRPASGQSLSAVSRLRRPPWPMIRRSIDRRRPREAPS
jgi:hypothetical protein